MTGSLIERTDELTPAPLAILRREDIVGSGRITLPELLEMRPEQGRAADAVVDNTGDGAAHANLRSLGSQRTLTLINGRRSVSGGFGADSAVDLTTIPLIVIDRIELMKAGGSALYGSGAMAGVVNIITRNRFEGLDAEATVGGTPGGDRLSFEASAIAGHTTKAHLASGVVALGIQTQSAVTDPALGDYLAAPSSLVSLFAAGSLRPAPALEGFVEGSYAFRSNELRPAHGGPATVLVSKDNLYNSTGADIVAPTEPVAAALGVQQSTQTTGTVRLVAGIRGAWAADRAHWELSYSFGHTSVASDSQNVLVASRFARAAGPSFLDPVSRPRCGTQTAPIAGCVPVDFLHPNLLTGEGQAYLAPSIEGRGSDQQQIVQAGARAQIASWAHGGELAIAAGSDVRWESGRFTPDTLVSDSTDISALTVDGSERALEGFGELSVIPVRNAGVLERVELDLAGRGFSLSPAASGTAWTAGGLVRTAAGVAVRGTYALTFRTPSLRERYASSDRVNANPDLEPETATIATAGLVVQPPVIAGLSLSVDYWNVDLDHEIQALSAAQILSGCFEDEVASLCDLIHRDPANSNQIDFLGTATGNIGAASFSGLDIAASYEQAFARMGRIRTQLAIQYRLDHSAPGFAEVDTGAGYDAIQSVNGEIRAHGSPTQALLSAAWSHPVGVSAGFHLRHVSSFRLAADSSAVVSAEIPAWTSLDVFASDSIKTGFGVVTLSAGINNVLDSAAPRLPIAGDRRAAFGSYDLVGRWSYVRAGYAF